MPNGVGMGKYQQILARAREEGTVNIVPGSLGWKYPGTKVKAAKKAKKADGKAPRTKTPQVQGPDLFTLCSMVEAGKLGADALLPHCVGGITISEIQEWYVTEGLARDLEGIRQRNGG